MLGAQALRTKQKVEEKERLKRQKQREKRLELERERIQKAANEDAAMLEMGQHSPVDREPPPKPQLHQRHSLHSTALSDHLDSHHHHQRPPTAARTEHRPSESSTSGNRLMRWLGLSSNSSSNNASKDKRRMSTF